MFWVRFRERVRIRVQIRVMTRVVISVKGMLRTQVCGGRYLGIIIGAGKE